MGARVILLHSAPSEFCIGRMVTRFGLLTIGVARGLRAAQARIEQLTRACPGDYVIFLRNTGRVVAKANSELQRG